MSSSRVRITFVLAMAMLLGRPVPGSEFSDTAWWEPSQQLSGGEAATPRAVGPLVVSSQDSIAVEGELPAGMRRLLGLLNDDPQRVRPCVIVLREFGLLRDQQAPSLGTPIRLAAESAFHTEPAQ